MDFTVRVQPSSSTLPNPLTQTLADLVSRARADADADPLVFSFYGCFACERFAYEDELHKKHLRSIDHLKNIRRIGRFRGARTDLARFRQVSRCLAPG